MNKKGRPVLGGLAGRVGRKSKLDLKPDKVSQDIFCSAVVDVKRVFDPTKDGDVFLDPPANATFRASGPVERRIAVGDPDVATEKDVQLVAKKFYDRKVKIDLRIEKRGLISRIIGDSLPNAGLDREDQVSSMAEVDRRPKGRLGIACRCRGPLAS